MHRKICMLFLKDLAASPSNGFIQEWVMVMNQLLVYDHLKERVLKILE